MGVQVNDKFYGGTFWITPSIWKNAGNGMMLS